MHPTVNIAVRAARAAGDIILRYHNQVDLLTIENKSENDFVSEVTRLLKLQSSKKLRRPSPSTLSLVKRVEK